MDMPKYLSALVKGKRNMISREDLKKKEAKREIRKAFKARQQM